MSEKDSQALLYQLDGKPPLNYAIPLGLQHILAMFASNLAPILIIAGLIDVDAATRTKMMQAGMFASGISTIVQLYPIPFIGKKRIGARLPIVMGTSFTFVAVLISVIQNNAHLEPNLILAIVLGASFFGGFVEIFLGFFMKQIKFLFPNALIGTVILVIGFKLINVGVTYFGGVSDVNSADFASPTNLLLGTIVFVTILLLQAFGKGLFKSASLLIGMVVGYVVAIFLNAVEFSAVSEAGIVSLPIVGVMPKFNLDAFIAIAFLYVVTTVETIGHVSGITVGALNRESDIEEARGAIFADGFGSIFASLCGALPNTSFGQNVGIVTLTKVVNRFAIFTGACFLIMAAFIPKIGAIFSTCPTAVLGGAVVSVFAMITITGLKVMARAGLSENNILIIATSLSLGYGFSTVPQLVAKLPVGLQMIFNDSAAAVCFVGVVVHLIILLRDKLFPGKYNYSEEGNSNSGGF